MKLVVAIVQARDADSLMQALIDRGFFTTQVTSTGGFLRESNVTLLTGVQEAYVPEVIRIARQQCHGRTRYVNPLLPIMEPAEYYVPGPVEVQVGGATIFVLNVERYERVA